MSLLFFNRQRLFEAKINYEEETVMLGDTLLYIKYGEKDIGKDKTAVK